MVKNMSKLLFRKIWKFISIFILVIALLIALIIVWAHHNPFSTDEEMIAYFQAHRGEIETLVKSYREYTRNLDEEDIWREIPSNKLLMDKIGIIDIYEKSPVWFPNPYSKEAEHQFNSDIEAKKFLQSDLRPYSTIGVDTDPNRIALVLLSSGVHYISKNIEYFPEEPLIVENNILWPVRSDGLVHTMSRLVPNLNSYPDDWKRLECVYRQIDTHWYLSMCMSSI
ncbi:MAG: hypothetical protein CTY34_01620 [Methylobacter sp.]|nr:MAG: hypothetical protein CTY34_01620 [Methylobacter sp.]